MSKKKFGWKTRENVGDLHFLVVDNFDFPRKLYSFVKIEFLDKNLTFRIVCEQWTYASKIFVQKLYVSMDDFQCH